jgi:hypothetical protein
VGVQGCEPYTCDARGAAGVLLHVSLLRRSAHRLVSDALALKATPTTFHSEAGTELASLLTSVTVGFFCWDLLRIDKWAKSSTRERRMMVTHHVLSIAVWPLAVSYRCAACFLLHYELTELSSPLLQLRWYLGLYFGRGSAAELGCAAAFALVFLGVRATNLRVVLGAFAASAPWNGALHPPCLPGWMRAVATCTLPLPSLLNLMWSLQILKMGARMIGGSEAEANKAATRARFKEQRRHSGGKEGKAA